MGQEVFQFTHEADHMLLPIAFICAQTNSFSFSTFYHSGIHSSM